MRDQTIQMNFFNFQTMRVADSREGLVHRDQKLSPLDDFNKIPSGWQKLY